MTLQQPVKVGTRIMTPDQLDQLIKQADQLAKHLKLVRFKYQQATGTGAFSIEAAIESGCSEATTERDNQP